MVFVGGLLLALCQQTWRVCFLTFGSPAEEMLSTEPTSPVFLALQADSFSAEPLGKPSKLVRLISLLILSPL